MQAAQAACAPRNGVWGSSAFAVLVFVISLVVFHWPFLADDGHWTPPQLLS